MVNEMIDEGPVH